MDERRLDPLDKRPETIEYKKGLTCDIRQMEKGKKEIEIIIKEQRKEVVKVKKLLTSEENKVPKAQRIMRAKIEEVLKKAGIDSAAYHGGDLTGNSVKILMGRASDLFSELFNLLKGEGESKGFTAEKLKHIEIRCSTYRDCLVLFDGFFSGLRTRPEELSNGNIQEMLAETSDYCEKAMACTENQCNIKSPCIRRALS
jgi:hypothetical protein